MAKTVVEGGDPHHWEWGHTGSFSGGPWAYHKRGCPFFPGPGLTVCTEICYNCSNSCCRQNNLGSATLWFSAVTFPVPSSLLRCPWEGEISLPHPPGGFSKEPRGRSWQSREKRRDLRLPKRACSPWLEATWIHGPRNHQLDLVGWDVTGFLAKLLAHRGSWSGCQPLAPLAGWFKPRMSEGVSTPPWPGLVGMCAPESPRASAAGSLTPCAKVGSGQCWPQAGWGRAAALAARGEGLQSLPACSGPFLGQHDDPCTAQGSIKATTAAAVSLLTSFSWPLFTMVQLWWSRFLVFEKEAICSKIPHWLVRLSQSCHLSASFFSFVKWESQ